VQQHAARAAALYSGRPSAPCFAPAPLFDLGLGAPVAAFELGQELCASADAIRMNSYLDWGEVRDAAPRRPPVDPYPRRLTSGAPRAQVVGYTLLWSIVWLAFHLFTRRFVLGVRPALSCWLTRVCALTDEPSLPTAARALLSTVRGQHQPWRQSEP
jgi:hypothetical protein